METQKYKVIKDDNQYNSYCSKLEALLDMQIATDSVGEEIELLTLLIEHWDKEHNTLEEVDPITILRTLMAEHAMEKPQLAKMLGLTQELVSEILNYKRGLSIDIIRKLSAYFKLSHDIFNRPYKLRVSENRRFKNASVMNTRKDMDLLLETTQIGHN